MHGVSLGAEVLLVALWIREVLMSHSRTLLKSERLLIELLEFVQEVMVVYSSEILMQNRCPFILTIKALFRQTARLQKKKRSWLDCGRYTTSLLLWPIKYIHKHIPGGFVMSTLYFYCLPCNHFEIR